MRLELVPLPVADVDRAKAFYRERAGFHVDHDVSPGGGVRVVQLTPPGSACSIVFGSGMGGVDQAPGSVRGLHLVVDDIAAARAELADRGVEMGGIDDLGGILFCGWSDPDGNSWTLQEIPPGTRLP